MKCLLMVLIIDWLSMTSAFNIDLRAYCTNDSVVEASNDQLLNISARYLTECAVQCHMNPLCKAYAFQNGICTGLDVMELNSPSKGRSNSSAMIYVSKEWMPLMPASTKLLVQSYTSAAWISQPSRMGGSPSTCNLPPVYPNNTYALVSTVIQGRVVLCGGNGSASCFSLNPISNAWENFPSLPVPLCYGGSTMTPFGWWITGGDSNGAWLSKSYMYNLFSATWASGPDLPKQNRMHCIVKMTPTTYLMAGGAYPYDTWMYDWQTRSWTQMQNMTVGRYGLTCGLFKYVNESQVVLAVGGSGYGQSSVAVEAFSLTSHTWSRLPDLSSGVNAASIVHDGSTLLLVHASGNYVKSFNATDSKFYMVAGLPTVVTTQWATVVEISDDNLYGCT